MKPRRELARAGVPVVDSRLFVADQHRADLLGDLHADREADAATAA